MQRSIQEYFFIMDGIPGLKNIPELKEKIDEILEIDCETNVWDYVSEHGRYVDLELLKNIGNVRSNVNNLELAVRAGNVSTIRWFLSDADLTKALYIAIRNDNRQLFEYLVRKYDEQQVSMSENEQRITITDNHVKLAVAMKSKHMFTELTRRHEPVFSMDILIKSIKKTIGVHHDLEIFNEVFKQYDRKSLDLIWLLNYAISENNIQVVDRLTQHFNPIDERIFTMFLSSAIKTKSIDMVKMIYDKFNQQVGYNSKRSITDSILSIDNSSRLFIVQDQNQETELDLIFSFCLKKRLLDFGYLKERVLLGQYDNILSLIAKVDNNFMMSNVSHYIASDNKYFLDNIGDLDIPGEFIIPLLSESRTDYRIKLYAYDRGLGNIDRNTLVNTLIENKEYENASRVLGGFTIELTIRLRNLEFVRYLIENNRIRNIDFLVKYAIFYDDRDIIEYLSSINIKIEDINTTWVAVQNKNMQALSMCKTFDTETIRLAILSEDLNILDYVLDKTDHTEQTILEFVPDIVKTDNLELFNRFHSVLEQYGFMKILVIATRNKKYKILRQIIEQNDQLLSGHESVDNDEVLSLLTLIEPDLIDDPQLARFFVRYMPSEEFVNFLFKVAISSRDVRMVYEAMKHENRRDVEIDNETQRHILSKFPISICLYLISLNIIQINPETIFTMITKNKNEKLGDYFFENFFDMLNPDKVEFLVLFYVIRRKLDKIKAIFDMTINKQHLVDIITTHITNHPHANFAQLSLFLETIRNQNNESFYVYDNPPPAAPNSGGDDINDGSYSQVPNRGQGVSDERMTGGSVVARDGDVVMERSEDERSGSDSDQIIVSQIDYLNRNRRREEERERRERERRREERLERERIERERRERERRER